MENQDIKRGIEFETRVGAGTPVLRAAFSWWKGNTLNQKSFRYILIVFALNLLIIFPVFGRDLTDAYAESAILNGIATVLGFLFISKSVFFWILTAIALLFSPISMYLFFRRIALRHEATAFLATLIFILPNPFFYNIPILVNAVLKGDGAHVLAFAFIPIILLYMQLFIRTGIPLILLLCSVSTSMIYILSPFASFNLLVLYLVITIADGYLGNLIVKMQRLLFLVVISSALSMFWYYPSLLFTILKIEHVQFALGQFWGFFPLIIPAIPVLGVVLFLVFDRREKLNPIFISMTLFIFYFMMFAMSSNYNVEGLYTSDRYLPELVFSASIFFAFLFMFLTKLASESFPYRLQESFSFFLIKTAQSAGVGVLLFLVWQGNKIVSQLTQMPILTYEKYVSIGSLPRVIPIFDVTAFVSLVISGGTFYFLTKLVKRFPSSIKRIAEEKAKVEETTQSD